MLSLFVLVEGTYLDVGPPILKISKKRRAHTIPWSQNQVLEHRDSFCGGASHLSHILCLSFSLDVFLTVSSPLLLCWHPCWVPLVPPAKRFCLIFKKSRKNTIKNSTLKQMLRGASFCCGVSHVSEGICVWDQGLCARIRFLSSRSVHISTTRT